MKRLSEGTLVSKSLNIKASKLVGGERRGLGPRNDVLTTCKAVTLRGGQQIIALGVLVWEVAPPPPLIKAFNCISKSSLVMTESSIVTGLISEFSHC